MKCKTCGKSLSKKLHFNREYCDECQKRARKGYYFPKMITPELEKKLLRHMGKLNRKQLSERFKISIPTLTRWSRYRGYTLAQQRYSKKLIKEVISYYIKHGKIKTQKRYPEVKLRSIIEKHNKGVCPRQKRWTDSQIFEAVRMAGIVTLKKQAEYFNRPHAHAGSITSLWNKRFNAKGSYINGLPKAAIRGCVTWDMPYYKVKFGKGVKHSGYCMAFWKDIEKHLKPSVSDVIRRGVSAMARFSEYLHGKENTVKNIIELIEEREHEKPKRFSDKERDNRYNKSKQNI